MEAGLPGRLQAKSLALLQEVSDGGLACSSTPSWSGRRQPPPDKSSPSLGSKSGLRSGLERCHSSRALSKAGGRELGKWLAPDPNHRLLGDLLTWTCPPAAPAAGNAPLLLFGGSCSSWTPRSQLRCCRVTQSGERIPPRQNERDKGLLNSVQGSSEQERLPASSVGQGSCS